MTVHRNQLVFSSMDNFTLVTSSLIENELKDSADSSNLIWLQCLAYIIIFINFVVYVIIPGAIFMYPSILAKFLFVDFCMYRKEITQYYY